MDATPNTLPFPERVEPVYRVAGGDRLKDLKIIVVLREPVARELSLYNHKVYEYSKTRDRTQWYSDVSREDGSVMSFDEYTVVVMDGIEYETPWGLANMGLYALHLRKWLEFVDRKQILAVTYDELKQHPETVQRRIRDFLGSDFPGSISIANNNENKAKVALPSCYAQRTLNSVFEPMNQDLYQLLNHNPGPLAEATPYPTFVQSKCVEPTQNSTNESTQTALCDDSRKYREDAFCGQE
jgi:hypothetical protein